MTPTTHDMTKAAEAEALAKALNHCIEGVQCGDDTQLYLVHNKAMPLIQQALLTAHQEGERAMRDEILAMIQANIDRWSNASGFHNHVAAANYISVEIYKPDFIEKIGEDENA